MPRPASRKKSELSKTVAELRKRLGLSQQEFSNRMGVALNTIARYETAREPEGLVLLRLAQIARAEGHSDLAWEFDYAFLGWITDATRGNEIFFATYAPPLDSGLLMLTLHNPEEMHLAVKFHLVLSHFKKLQDGREREALLHVLDSAVAAITEKLKAEDVEKQKAKKRK
jgi:transcriptional regulator with XRE-family HTH domain